MSTAVDGPRAPVTAIRIGCERVVWTLKRSRRIMRAGASSNCRAGARRWALPRVASAWSGQRPGTGVADDVSPAAYPGPVGGTMVLAGVRAAGTPRPGERTDRGCVISCGHFTVSGAAVGDHPGGVDEGRVDQSGPCHRRRALRLLPRLDGHGPVDQPLPELDSRDDQLDQFLTGPDPVRSARPPRGRGRPRATPTADRARGGRSSTRGAALCMRTRDDLAGR